MFTDDLLNKAMPVVLVVGIVFGLYCLTSGSPPQIGNNALIKAESSLQWERGKDEPDKTYKFVHLPSGDEFTAHLYGDELYEPPGQREKVYTSGPPRQIWDVEATKYVYTVDWGLDIGVVGALETGQKGHEDLRDFDVLLRVSPCRLFNNHIAPDVLISDQAIGFGVGFFPVPNTYNRMFRHVGVELGYVNTPLDDRWRVLIGVSTEFRF